jgi:hypothetical protein
MFEEEKTGKVLSVYDKPKAFFYGRKHDLYCDFCKAEINASKASDVCFNDFSSDVVAIYCPNCGILEVFQY